MARRFNSSGTNSPGTIYEPLAEPACKASLLPVYLADFTLARNALISADLFLRAGIAGLKVTSAVLAFFVASCASCLASSALFLASSAIALADSAMFLASSATALSLSATVLASVAAFNTPSIFSFNFSSPISGT